MARYGDLFRPPGETPAVGDPLLRAEDVEPVHNGQPLAVSTGLDGTVRV